MFGDSYRRLVLSAALAGAASIWTAQPAAAADYDRIKQIAQENGIAELRMTEAGGPSGESIEKGYLNPFTEKSGIAVVRESPSGLGKLRAMVEAGNVTSVLLELSSPELEQAKALDLVEPLDWDAIAPEPMFEEAKDEYGYGYQYYTTLMAWRADAKAPQSWQDFWDVEAFPGKRALPDYAAYILPMALLADGVAVEELYPLDLDRAAGGGAGAAAAAGQRGPVRGRLVRAGRRPGRPRVHLPGRPAGHRLLRGPQGGGPEPESRRHGHPV